MVSRKWAYIFIYFLFVYWFLVIYRALPQVFINLYLSPFLFGGLWKSSNGLLFWNQISFKFNSYWRSLLEGAEEVWVLLVWIWGSLIIMRILIGKYSPSKLHHYIASQLLFNRIWKTNSGNASNLFEILHQGINPIG